MKLRPIDDCLEAQINHAFTVSSYLKLQDIDYIGFFFRPTPYGFRQVVQHVSKHVAYEIN